MYLSRSPASNQPDPTSQATGHDALLRNGALQGVLDPTSAGRVVRRGAWKMRSAQCAQAPGNAPLQANGFSEPTQEQFQHRNKPAFTCTCWILFAKQTKECLFALGLTFK